MKKYGVNELREMYLSFFESKGHLRMKSFSLVPHNDNSLLLINAGMAPLKPYFTGQEIPPRRRVTTCQKCIRTGDLENVGKTARHGTFFEMLGNFSFGDYFKTEAIHWSWEFLTEVIGLDPDRLYPSVYKDDDEAFDIWNKEIGIAKDRIFRFGKEDNFWEHGAGPCGPCSEIYYDRGEKYGCGKPTCTVGCDCDRYMEVWNNVFTQFENDGHNNYTELKNKNIDTGMGLERLAVIVQDVDSIFDVDTIKDLRDKVCEMAHKAYHVKEEDDVSIRIITDHIRSATFMISDGIMPSNEGRGYVLRRLIRRAARHGKKLGIRSGFLSELCVSVIEGSKVGYPELEEKQSFIQAVLAKEEEQFDRTIDQGLAILNEYIDDLKKSGEKTLSGDAAFKLYDTYGFPLDLTLDELSESGLTVDQDGFDKCMEKQKETARAARKTTNYMGADATVYDKIDVNITSEFVGYDRLTADSKISVITNSEDLVDAIAESDEASIIVDQTPFYSTMGGQVGDHGTITGADGAEFTVRDTIPLKGGRIAHIGVVKSGMFRVGDKVTLSVDPAFRADTCKNHSATHLLQKALKTVLGDHVEQKGSYVDNERLRFDFSHYSAMTPEEIQKTEDLVNDAIKASYDVVTKVMSLDEAKKTGAMALFGEKYGDKVRVVNMGYYSIELCGGTHVKNTSEIRLFKILSESGVASGVRRIEALTGDAVIRYYKSQEKLLSEAADAAKSEPEKLADHIKSLEQQIKDLISENRSLKDKLAASEIGDAAGNAEDIAGVKFLTVKIPGADMDTLRTQGDSLKNKLGTSVVVLASDNGGKVSLVVMATDDAVKKGAHAGNIIKEAAKLVGGGGGGRPGNAQAGGKNPAGIDDAFRKAKEVLSEQLS